MSTWMPSKLVRNILAANELAKSRPKRPVAKASWEQTTSKPLFKKSVAFSSASSIPSSNVSCAPSEGELTRHVRPVTAFEEAELARRTNSLYKPRRLQSETQAQFVQVTLRHKEAWGQAHPTAETRRDQRNWRAFQRQQAQPIDYRPFESNFFDR